MTRLNGMFKKERGDIFDRVSDRDVFRRVEDEDLAVDNVSKNVSSILSQLDLKSDSGESDKRVMEAFKSLVKEMKTRERNKETESLKSQIQELIRAEIAKIKPVQNVIEKQLETIVKHVEVPIHIPPPPPQQTIIKEKPQIIERVIEAPKGKYVEASVVDELKKEIESLKKQLKETDEMARMPSFIPGGSGVIGIPPPEGNDGKTLKVSGNKAQWVTVSASGGASISGYTVNDATERKELASDASLDEIRQVLGTLLTELQA